MLQLTGNCLDIFVENHTEHQTFMIEAGGEFVSVLTVCKMILRLRDPLNLEMVFACGCEGQGETELHAN